MVVWNLFFTTVLLPLIAIAMLWRRPRRPIGAWFATLILAAGVAGFGILVAPWGWFGIPLRVLLIALFALAVVMSLRRQPNDDPNAAPTSVVRLGIMILIGFFFGNVAIGVLRANRVPADAVNVAFPLTRGTYLVVQGGSEPAANNHFAVEVQRSAVDIVKLNRAGMRASGIYPNDAKRYAIFGDTVVSPCDGVVINAVDQFSDAARISIDEKNPAGNHVVLRCGDADVTLAHLQRGSVAVRAKQTIARGATIGRVGNTGRSTEPHLHAHAERNGAPVPLLFDGRWLVRNDLIRK